MTNPIGGPSGSNFPDPKKVQPVVPAQPVQNNKKGPQEEPPKQKEESEEVIAERKKRRTQVLQTLNKQGKSDEVGNNETGQNIDFQV